jgi:hypothetical protein
LKFWNGAKKSDHVARNFHHAPTVCLATVKRYSAGGMMLYDEQVCLMVYYIFNSGATFNHFAGILGMTESTT